MSLSYDELEVYLSDVFHKPLADACPGVATAIPERACSVPCYRSDKVQLCLGFGEEPGSRAPGGRRPATARHVLPAAARHCR